VDFIRQHDPRRRTLRRAAYSAAGLGGMLAITFLLSSLKPAAPLAERGSVWVDTVKRGPMLRQVRGLGTLVPEEVRWIPAQTEGRVERIRILPGTAVRADSVILEMSNPELELAALDSASQLRAAEAELVNLRVQLESQRLNQEAEAARVRAEYRQAQLQAEANRELARDGLIPDLTLRLSEVAAEQLAGRAQIEQKRLEIAAEAIEAQIKVQESRVEQLRALHRLKRQQLDALTVRAGIDGVLEHLPVEVGQRLPPGTVLARVARPERLKAELRIPETQARDIQIGQIASIDTRNGVVAGRVSRIDPAVQNGTVTVDVSFSEPLPKGARSDLSVDGTVELERLADVLFVGRPAFGQPQSRVGLFRLEKGGRDALRVEVELGRASVNSVEILDGLQEGDQVILSDTTAWDAHDRLRLK
jgi:HlyD family secretion protein